MKLNLSKCNNDVKWILNEVKEITDICFDENGKFLLTEQREEPGFQIENRAQEIIIRYGRKTDFCRALLTVCSKENKDYGFYEEKSSFEEFGVMLDFSRNAVMRVEKIKQYIRLLALMGYQFLGLYMEDTIEVIEEPYLGYMRGSMTGNELKEIDDYAKLFDLEIRAYIQTLAHLNQITRYEEYQKFIDTEDILLAGEERTYEFLSHLIKTVGENISSRKINIGMDEAHMVGLGKYLDKNGYSNRFDIMNHHLERVLDICRQYGLKVQMWSDMYFRLAFGGDYYVDKELAPDLLKIPEGVELVYWDYYSCEKEHYDKMLKQHKIITEKIGFAGGAWKWTGFAPHNAYSMEIGRAAILSCKENKVSSVVITAWGDNGAEAGNFSILPALYADAEYNYTENMNTAVKNAEFKNSMLKDSENIDRGSTVSDNMEVTKFQILTGMTFKDFVKLDLPNCFLAEDNDNSDYSSKRVTIHNNASKYLLYNDVFLGTFDSVIIDGIAKTFEGTAMQLEKCADNKTFGYLFDTLAKLCRVLQYKADLGIKLKNAYDKKDIAELLRLTEDIIPKLQKELNVFYLAFENQWHIENKPFGFEVQCIRFGGLQKRLEYVQKRLQEYLYGDKDSIEELDADRKPFSYFKDNDIHELNYNLWHDIVSPSVIG